MKLITPVTVPSCHGSTAFCTDTVVIGSTVPSPQPVISSSAPTPIALSCAGISAIGSERKRRERQADRARCACSA